MHVFCQAFYSGGLGCVHRSFRDLSRILLVRLQIWVSRVQRSIRETLDVQKYTRITTPRTARCLFSLLCLCVFVLLLSYVCCHEACLRPLASGHKRKGATQRYRFGGVRRSRREGRSCIQQELGGGPIHGCRLAAFKNIYF